MEIVGSLTMINWSLLQVRATIQVSAVKKSKSHRRTHHGRIAATNGKSPTVSAGATHANGRGRVRGRSAGRGRGRQPKGKGEKGQKGSEPKGKGKEKNKGKSKDKGQGKENRQKERATKKVARRAAKAKNDSQKTGGKL